MGIAYVENGGDIQSLREFRPNILDWPQIYCIALWSEALTPCAWTSLLVCQRQQLLALCLGRVWSVAHFLSPVTWARGGGGCQDGPRTGIAHHAQQRKLAIMAAAWWLVIPLTPRSIQTSSVTCLQCGTWWPALCLCSQIITYSTIFSRVRQESLSWWCPDDSQIYAKIMITRWPCQESTVNIGSKLILLTSWGPWCKYQWLGTMRRGLGCDTTRDYKWPPAITEMRQRTVREEQYSMQPLQEAWEEASGVKLSISLSSQ